jgi:hypothetical protein
MSLLCVKEVMTLSSSNISYHTLGCILMLLLWCLHEPTQVPHHIGKVRSGVDKILDPPIALQYSVASTYGVPISMLSFSLAFMTLK